MKILLKITILFQWRGGKGPQRARRAPQPSAGAMRRGMEHFKLLVWNNGQILVSKQLYQFTHMKGSFTIGTPAILGG